MSLSCLLCQPTPRTDSPYVSPSRPSGGCHSCIGLDRTWSGGIVASLTRTASTLAQRNNAERKGHRKMSSDISALIGCRHRVSPLVMPEPRLVRSGGMRRDWSFEDLRNRAAAARRRR